MQGLESLNKFQNFVSTLGGLGRYGDTYMVHAEEGETVVPMEVLDRNPVLRERLFESMRDMGIEPERYIVGNEFNSINPLTGQPEFFLKWLGKRLKKAVRDIGSRTRKAAADISGYAAPILGAMYGPLAGAGVGALLGQYKRENPGDPSQWKQMALRGGLSGLAANVATGQGLLETGLSDVYNTWNPLDIGAKLLTPEGWGEALKKGGDWRMFQQGSGLDRIFDVAKSKNIPLDPNASGEAQKTVLQKIFGIDKIIEWTAKGWLSWKLGDIIKKENEEAEKEAAEAAKDYGKRTVFSQFPSLMQSGEIVTPPGDALTDVYAAAEGGIMDLQGGGESRGPGTGTSDSIPAMLSDGEFVMTADAVRGAGGGDRREGARRMYQMMDNLERSA